MHHVDWYVSSVVNVYMNAGVLKEKLNNVNLPSRNTIRHAELFTAAVRASMLMDTRLST
jgi:hypothetical protein